MAGFAVRREGCLAFITSADLALAVVIYTPKALPPVYSSATPISAGVDFLLPAVFL